MHFTSLTDLIRLIRNTRAHYHELKIKSFYENYEGRVCGYFMETFPELFMFIYKNKSIRKEREKVIGLFLSNEIYIISCHLSF